MRGSKPAGRTLVEFQPLKPAELKLLDACRQGTEARISAERPVAANDDNTVRAAFLRFLALGGDVQAPVHEHGVQLVGAWIEGMLDMAAAKVPSGLVIWACHFDIIPVFRGAKIAGTLNLGVCKFPGLNGDGLVCEGNLFLRPDAIATGEVRLLGAQIGGDLDCSGAKFDGKDGAALTADGAVIQGSAFFEQDFTATGGVRLPGVRIGVNLACKGAKFDGKNGDALMADGAVIKGNVFLNESYTMGAVRLHGANIDGGLVCRGAEFDGKDGDALSADGAVIQGGVFLDREFSATGKVRLVRIQIGGSLECRNAKFDGKNGDALSANGAVIKGSVFLNEGFTATGKVQLKNTRIGENLECINAKFNGREGNALLAEGMVVEGTFTFRDLILPVNGISLASSQVGRLMDDKDSWGKGLYLDGFTYDSIIGDTPTDAATRLEWLDKQYQPLTGLNGDGADFKPQPWRQLAKVLQEMGHAEDARQVSIAFEHRLRKANLIGQTPKHPHWLFKLFSWFYRKVSRVGHWLFWLFTGYGYRPLRLLGWMFGMWLLCATIYWYAALNGVFAPSNPLVFQNPDYKVCAPSYVAPAPKRDSAAPSSIQGAGNWYLCDKLPEEYSGFSPLAYSLDVILPLVDLQQESSWSPLIPTPKNVWYRELATFDLKYITRLVLWLEILFGWLSSLLLVAVVSGLTKRREE